MPTKAHTAWFYTYNSKRDGFAGSLACRIPIPFARTVSNFFGLTRLA